MWALLIVVCCAVYPVRTIQLFEDIGPFSLRAKLGAEGSLPEKYVSLSLRDKYAGYQASKYWVNKFRELDPLKIKKSKLLLFKMPEIKFNSVIRILDLEVLGLRYIRFPEYIEVRTESNRVDFNARIPILKASVDLELGTTFGKNSSSLNTVVRARITLFNLNVTGACHFTESPSKSYRLHNADLNIVVDYSQFVLDVIIGLEEFKYLLASILNNPLDRIGDAVLKEVQQGINEALENISSDVILDYLTCFPPRSDSGNSSRQCGDIDSKVLNYMAENPINNIYKVY